MKNLPVLANDGTAEDTGSLDQAPSTPSYMQGGGFEYTPPAGKGMPRIEDSGVLGALKSAAEKYNIPVDILANLVKNESGFNPNAVSPVGAQGLAQLMPETAKELGVTDPFDVHQNLHGAASYLRKLINKLTSNVIDTIF